MKKCNFCGKKIGSKKTDKIYSASMYDSRYIKYGYKDFCKKCAKSIFRILLANEDSLMEPLINEVKDRTERLMEFKENVKKI